MLLCFLFLYPFLLIFTVVLVANRSYFLKQITFPLLLPESVMYLDTSLGELTIVLGTPKTSFLWEFLMIKIVYIQPLAICDYHLSIPPDYDFSSFCPI